MDWVELAKLFFAMLLVLSLMGILAIVLQHFDAPGRLDRLMNAKNASDKRKRRLKVTERCSIDRMHTAVILQIDNREHLVILGANGDTVLESRNIAHNES